MLGRRVGSWAAAMPFVCSSLGALLAEISAMAFFGENVSAGVVVMVLVDALTASFTTRASIFPSPRVAFGRGGSTTFALSESRVTFSTGNAAISLHMKVRVLSSVTVAIFVSSSPIVA